MPARTTLSHQEGWERFSRISVNAQASLYCQLDFERYAAPRVSFTRSKFDFPGRRDSVRLSVRHSCEQVRIVSKLRHSLLDLALHLLDVDVQSIAIDRTVRLEVEDRR